MLSTPAQKFKIETQERSSLYYGQFRYSARFYLKHASCLRANDHSVIDSILAMRMRWPRSNDIIDETVVRNVHQVFDQLLGVQNDYKKTISSHWLYFYTNHIEDIETLNTGPMRQVGNVGQANVTRQHGTVSQVNPKYQYRTYCFSHKPTQYQMESLKQFVKNSGSDIKVSPGFRDCINGSKYIWIMDHYFIDYNDTKIQTMLALINPRLIRKTMPIVRINN